MDVYNQIIAPDPGNATAVLLDGLLNMANYSPDPRIQAAREHLVDFMEYDGEGRWIREPYLEKLCDAVESVFNGEILRLIVTIGPRQGKSQVISKKAPAWYLGNHPHEEIILTSYAADLAYDFSRIARETLRNRREIFPIVNVDRNSSSVAHWTLDGYDGGLVAAGVGGPITGRGAKIAIIDDPFKNWEEAQSTTIRETVWNWYLTTLRTRLAPKGGIILVLTRWHEDDLAGRLINKQDTEDGEEWTVINMPAISESLDDPLGRPIGTAHLSERYPDKEILALRKALGLYKFNALYQGRPRPEEGNYFKKQWFPRLCLHEFPKDVFVYAAGDFAIDEKTQNDWNTLAAVGVTSLNEPFVLDMDRFKGDSGVIVDHILDFQEKHNPINFGFEDGQIRKAIWPIVQDQMKKRNVFVNPLFLVPIKDKMARARALQARARNGNIIYPKEGSTPWIDELVEEMLNFPNGKWDDQVDALAWVFIMLTKLTTIGAGIDMESIAA